MSGGAPSVIGGGPWELRPNYLQDLKQRFWSHIQKTPNCWLWRGPTVGRGYGKLGAFGKTQRAHRVAWILTFGPITDGLLVCHKCDTPACCRPDHLFLGTSDDNNKDMARKKRSATGIRSRAYTHPETVSRGDQHYSRTHPEKLARGEMHPNAKLTEQDVREIRRIYARGKLTLRQIGAMFGVSSCPILNITKGRGWKHVRGSD